MRGPYYLESVERVMNVLDAFTIENQELRLTDLSEILGIPKPQVLRIVTTLEHGGYLIRDAETKRFRLGLRLFSLGTIAGKQIDIRRIARPALEELAETTRETVGLFVPDDAGPVCVDVIESPQGVRVFAQLGRRMPWNAGTSAKVILAYLQEDEREQILSGASFRQFTPFTVTDPEILRELLDKIREDGYHVGVRDLDEGAAGIAGPLFLHNGQIAGAISMSAPITRLRDDNLGSYLELVQEACARTSYKLGHSRPASPAELART